MFNEPPYANHPISSPFAIATGVSLLVMRLSSSTAEDAVRGLSARGASDGGDLLREVGLLRSQLEYAVDPSPDEVDGLIEMVQQATARASDVVAAAFFRPVGTIVWSN